VARLRGALGCVIYRDFVNIDRVGIRCCVQMCYGWITTFGCAAEKKDQTEAA